MNKQKIYFILALFLALVFSTPVFASLTFSTDAITGTTASTMDVGAGNALNLQTINNGNVIIGSGRIGIGTAIPDDFIKAEIDTNTIERFTIKNLNAGTSARTILRAFADTASGTLTAFSSGNTQGLGSSYTTNGILAANLIRLSANSASAFIIDTTSATPIILGTNSTEYLRITSTGNIGIGTATPGASSILDISSTTKGVVLPRMTQAQRNAIATPVAGMAIYQTDAVPGLRVYNGTNWMRFTETAD